MTDWYKELETIEQPAPVQAPTMPGPQPATPQEIPQTMQQLPAPPMPPTTQAPPIKPLDGMLQRVNQQFGQRKTEQNAQGVPTIDDNEMDVESVDWWEEANSQSAPPQPTVSAAPPTDDRNILQKASDMFSGDDRQTKAIEGMSELDVPMFDTRDGFFSKQNLEHQGRLAKSALGLLTTFDPKRQVNILKENLPDLKFEEDEKGNVIIDATAYGGEKSVLNMPGISPLDLRQAGFQIAAFTPAAKSASLAKTMTGKATNVGASSAATQTALDLTGQAVGGTDDVSLGNVDKGDVAIAGLGGAAFEVLFQSLAKAVPFLRKSIDKSGITEDVRQTFRQVMIDAGRDPGEITDDVIKSFLDSTEEAATLTRTGKPNPSASAARQGEKEFGINLTEGQRTGNQKQLSFEDSARSGMFGDKAQQRMLAKEAEQSQQAVDAMQNIQADIAKGNPIVRSQQEAGGVMTDAIRAAERQADDLVGNAYQNVGKATLDGRSVGKMYDALIASVKSPDFIKHKSLAPSTAEFLEKIQGYRDTISQMAETQPARLANFKTGIKELEQVRRIIKSHINAAANPSDARSLLAIKQSFDNFMDDAVKNALFSGDKEALNQLKNARALSRDYFTKYTSQPAKTRTGRTIPDREGALIEKIIADNPTNEQVVNAVFGASNFNNTAGANMAKRFKSIVGETSEEWQALRQAGFMRLIKFKPDGKTISGQQTAQAIRQAVGKNKSLMQELFTPEEMGVFNRFAAQVKRTDPDIVRSRENPSGTAQKLIKSMTTMITRLGESMGFATGNAPLVLGSKGVEVASGFRASSKAQRAVRPFQKALEAKPGYVSGATAASVSGSQPD